MVDGKVKKGKRTIVSLMDGQDRVKIKQMLRCHQNTRTAQTKAIIILYFCERCLALVCFCIMMLSVTVSFVFLIALIFCV